jgi:hypothetical protein
LRLAEIFAREVLGFLVDNGLLSPEWAERILSWRHTGFNVHSRVRAKTKLEAERVGKYMIRPVLALERLSFLDRDGKVGYRWGRQAAELETMDYLEFIARVTSHIRIHSPHSSRRLAWQEGQNPRGLQKNIRNRSSPQSGQQIRANPQRGLPQSR